MKRSLAALGALTLLAIACGSADALWMYVPPDKLAAQSDAIVIGRLGKVRKSWVPTIPPLTRGHYYEATIEVERMVWPQKRAPKTMTLRWHMAGVSTDHEPPQGIRTLWLLRRVRFPFSGYSANNPGRTIRLTRTDSVRRVRDELKSAASMEPPAQRVLKALDDVLAEGRTSRSR